MDVTTLARRWWTVALRGAAAVLFGILTLLMPGITLWALVLLFGSYAVVDGVFSVIAALRGEDDEEPWWALLLHGLVSIAAGLVAFFLPGLSALALLYVIAAWAVVTGALEIAAAVRLRKRITGEWWLALSGILSVVFGVVLMIAPAAGALALVVWIGAFAIALGGLLIGLALQLRSWRVEPPRRMTRAA
jgi:uncharacterized membrane protein HdeD (DUF308 family)